MRDFNLDTTQQELEFPSTSFLKASRTLTVRWLWRLRRDKPELAASLIQPVVWLILFGNLFTNVVFVAQTSYVAFMTAGVVVMTVFNETLGGGVEILFDKESGVLQRLMATPIPTSSIVASRLSFVLIISCAQSLIILALAQVLGVGLASGFLGLILILAVGVVFGVGIMSASLALAFGLRGHEQFFSITSLISLPLLFISSALVPESAMPAWLREAAMLNPLTYAIDGTRQLILVGISISQLSSVFEVTLFFDACMFALAVWVVKRHQA
jgi:ABC-2 type transport system permease protein